MNNPLINPMNFNFNPIFNDNMNLNPNQFMMNLNKIQYNKPKINAVFNVKEYDYEIMKFSSNPGYNINISIDPEKSINDLLIEFFKRIEKTNINEIKDKFIFSYSGYKLDFNDKTKIKDLIKIKLQGTAYFNIYVKHRY